MTSRIRSAAVIAGLSSLLILTACSAPTETTSDPDPTVEETPAPVAAPETACPDGFVEAYTAELTSIYEPGLAVTEVSVDDFAPAFLAPFLDGGCAVHVTGVLIGGGGGVPVDGDYGFAADAATSDAIAAALEANGYEEDPNFPGGYQSDTRFAAVFIIGGEVTVGGQAALEQYYAGGVVFYA